MFLGVMGAITPLVPTSDYPLVPTSDYVETVHDVRFVMKAIPSGTFLMGCGEADEPCADAEWVDKAKGIRQQAVTIEPFFLAETETTWALYQQCMDAGACATNDPDGGDNGWGKGERPVIEVSWYEITDDFLPWLNEITGKDYRLPSEAEWAYAARAGTQTKYHTGDTITCAQARFGYMADLCGKPASTVPVKSYPPNAFGLYDMHGNVWEYVQDCWSEGLGASAQNKHDSACEESVLRGGSWLNGPDDLRVAMRFRHDRTYRESGDGFRLAHSME